MKKAVGGNSLLLNRHPLSYSALISAFFVAPSRRRLLRTTWHSLVVWQPDFGRQDTVRRPPEDQEIPSFTNLEDP